MVGKRIWRIIFVEGLADDHSFLLGEMMQRIISSFSGSGIFGIICIFLMKRVGMVIVGIVFLVIILINYVSRMKTLPMINLLCMSWSEGVDKIR